EKRRALARVLEQVDGIRIAVRYRDAGKCKRGNHSEYPTNSFHVPLRHGFDAVYAERAKPCLTQKGQTISRKVRSSLRIRRLFSAIVKFSRASESNFSRAR